MLHVNGLTYRIAGRLLLEDASVAIPGGHKVGLVGRNGVGKTTLLHLILGDLQSEAGTIGMPRNARIGTVARRRSPLRSCRRRPARLTSRQVS